MYLTLLSEEQKKCFLGLAYNLSNIDGDFSESEKQMLESYCTEMDFVYSDSIAKVDLEILLANITNLFDEKSIKVVVFELVGLAMIDDNFDESEYKMLNKIIEKFIINSDFIKECENLIKKYLDVQFNINSLILK